MRKMTAALKGLKPRPTMMAPQMATGLPPPAAPSRNAPNAKPLRTAWMRASPESPATDRRTMRKSPETTETSYIDVAPRAVKPPGRNAEDATAAGEWPHDGNGKE